MKEKCLSKVYSNDIINKILKGGYMETKKIRESNLELLRIISMISIFIYHYCVHGGILEVGSYTINKSVALFFSIGGRVGVNIFILIMGYFMVKSQFKIKRIIISVHCWLNQIIYLKFLSSYKRPYKNSYIPIQ